MANHLSTETGEAFMKTANATTSVTPIPDAAATIALDAIKPTTAIHGPLESTDLLRVA